MQINSTDTKFTKCSSIEIPENFYNRMSSGNDDIDRMFGTEHLMGFMPGTAITITGTPGSGKTTFLAQVGQMLSDQGKRAAIASGEESHIQIAYTCNRLGVSDVDVAHCKNVEDIAAAMANYDILVVDSFQSLRSDHKMGIRQFRQYSQDLLLNAAKENNCVLIFVLHITTSGLPKGGTDIIHAVDVNMKITVDPADDGYRLIQVYKNRFGETKCHRTEMTSKGHVFLGVYDEAEVEGDEDEDNKSKTPVSEKRKDILLDNDLEELTLNAVTDYLGISGQTAGNILRELVCEGKAKKIGRGANSVWKVAKDINKFCKKF